MKSFMSQLSFNFSPVAKLYFTLSTLAFACLLAALLLVKSYDLIYILK